MNTLMQEFQPLTEEAFAFLETSFKFTRTLLAEGMLRYKTENVFVIVGYDGQRSYGLPLDLGQRSLDLDQRNVTKERSFCLPETRL